MRVLRDVEWEWIIIDDHSLDDTCGSVRRIASEDPRVRGIRLANNSGSHVAITCGLRYARGDAAALVVADLQDPPELLTAMFERWQQGSQVVWAARRRSPASGRSLFPTIYYWILRNLAGLKIMPSAGVDFFLIDRVVIDAFLARVGRHVSVFVLLMSLGFRQEFIEFDKQARAHGTSRWTLSRKLKLVVDSLLAISPFGSLGQPPYSIESEITELTRAALPAEFAGPRT